LTDTTILIAVIGAPQGLDGSVRLTAFTDEITNLKRYKTFSTARGPLTLKKLREQPNALVVKFAEFPDRTEAEKWRGVELFVARTQLPDLADGEYYQSDLVGMSVITDAGTTIGTVMAIPNYGAGDLLDIKLADGTEKLLPFNDDVVLRVDAASRQLVIDPDYLSEA
jgi:16S rRNA processing protein RimM